MDKKIAFEKKLEHFEPALKAYALKLMHDTNDAKDLVQETFMKAIIHSSKFKTGTNLKGWLFTIMYNSFISNYRKAVRKNKLIHTQIEKFINDKASPIHTQNKGELKFINQDISNAINRLPDQLRVIFEMNILGYKYHEIAEKFDLPLGTIKTKIYYARKRLKNSLHEYRKTYNLSNL
jgi:RNA polymerase sigma-70 factor (ECF subfamily)